MSLCTEHVSVTTRDDLEQTYRHKKHGIYYWKEAQFEHSMDSHVGRRFVERTIEELRKRVRAGRLCVGVLGVRASVYL